jgi:hypothetical protein
MALTLVPGNIMTSPVSLTGNLTVAGSGGITFSDASSQTAAASPYVLKNRLINGGFNVSQYNGTSSVTPTAVGYYIDRWYIDTFGGGFNSLTMQQLSASPPTGYSNYLQIASGSTTYTNINLSQSIETANCYDLAGQTVTLSFWYKVPVNWTNQWIAYISSNTSSNTKINGGSSGTTASTGLTLSNTTTWTKATLTYTIPSNAQTIGVLFSNGNNNLINGAQFQITGVQLELGTSATPFERRLYGQELINCQRYCQRWTGNGVSTQAIIAMGMQTSVTSSAFNVQTAVPMRSAPTATFSSLIVSDSIAFDAAVSLASVDNYASTSSYFGVSHASAGASNRPVRLSPASGSSGFLNFSAEL